MGQEDMSFFQRLFKNAAMLAKDDPAFGRIEFCPSHGIDMWCRIPAGTGDHMIIVDAPLSGPSQAQRDFYSKLQACLAQREAECKEFISKQPDPPANLASMTVYSVEIGPEQAIATGQFVIELADADASEIHRVEFKNDRPETYGVDD